jgi:hypothetical protein
MDGLDIIRNGTEFLVYSFGHTIFSYDYGPTIRCDWCYFDNADAFVDLSRENEAVRSVTLAIPFTDPGDDVSGTHDRYAWEKIEGIGNLQLVDISNSE